MRKKKSSFRLLSALLALLLLASCGGGTPKKPNDLLKAESVAVFDGGDGTEEHPYVITTPEGLSAVCDNLSAHYRMNANEVSHYPRRVTLICPSNAPALMFVFAGTLTLVKILQP